MRIAIFGTGAVGGYFGGRLALAGEDVIFIARGEHMQAMRDNGLRVDSIKGDFVVQPVFRRNYYGEIPIGHCYLYIDTFEDKMDFYHS